MQSEPQFLRAFVDIVVDVNDDVDMMLMLKFGHDFQKFGQYLGVQVWSRFGALPSDQLQQYLHQLLCIFKRVMLHGFLIENSLLTKTYRF